MKKRTVSYTAFLLFSLAIIGSCGNSNTMENQTGPMLSPSGDSLVTKTPVDNTKSLNKQALDTSQANAKQKTIENMKTAYRGEMTATAKYAAYSKKAESDGFHPVALLYKGVSIAENIHASNHRKVLQEASAVIPIVIPAFVVKSTKENLHDDIEGEANEAKTIYPSYLKMAEEANNQLAHTSILYAMETEKKHKVFFEKALGDINSNTMQTMPSVYFVCPDCGNTYEASAPKRCDFSLTPREKFIKITTL